MPLREPSVAALLDREIMLTCLAEAVAEEPAERLDPVFQGGALQARIRATRVRRVARQQGAEARSMRAEVGLPDEDAQQPSPLPGLRGQLATARLMLELRRGDLAVSRDEAADLRLSARALRGQAIQIRRRARRPYG